MYQTLNMKKTAGRHPTEPAAEEKFIQCEMRQELERAASSRQTAFERWSSPAATRFFAPAPTSARWAATANAESSYRHAREFQILFDQVESLPQPVSPRFRVMRSAAVANWPWRRFSHRFGVARALVCRKSRSAPFPAAAGRKDWRV